MPSESEFSQKKVAHPNVIKYTVYVHCTPIFGKHLAALPELLLRLFNTSQIGTALLLNHL